MITARISAVHDGSIAAEVDLQPGDRILSINGEVPRDVIDYRYMIAEEDLELAIVKANGEEWIVEIEKEIDEPLGLEFESPTFDGLKACRNRCVFCFVDQQPPGLRDTLYVKDDDYRHSFLHGSYITLTNLSDEDFGRIAKQRLSPLYVSVHTTNPELRQDMMGSHHAGGILVQLQRLIDAGIDVHTQVVLCPSWNDGPELDKTIADLSALGPALRTLAIVPIGLTRHREGLPPINAYTPKEARAVVDQVTSWQRRLGEAGRLGFVYLADEFYMRAGQEVPAYDHYQDFEQLSNGVGLVRLFLAEADAELRMIQEEASEDWSVEASGRNSKDAAIGNKRRVTIVTGVSGQAVLQTLVDDMERAFGVRATMARVQNRFFGDSVTVTGLLTGIDIEHALKTLNGGQGPLGDEILIPGVCLQQGTDRFLDGKTVGEIAACCSQPLRVIDSSGRSFVRAVLGSGDKI